MNKSIAAGGWALAAIILALASYGPRQSRVLAAGGGQEIRYLNPAGIAAPVARYSYAVAVPPGKELIYLSGQSGDGSNGEPVSSDIVAQTRQTMENLKKVLEAAGSDFAHVVKMNIYLTDMDHMPELRKVRDAYLDPKHAPAMTTAKVLQLVGTDTKIEIEVIAVRSR